jgi:adhesin transport system membrane fusion protein
MSTSGSHRDEDLFFMPDVHAAARRRGRTFAYALTLTIFLFFLVFGIWANFAVLDEVTRGEGTVVSSSKTQVIQNLEGGILAGILVREGDIVDKGDILVRIDNTAARATFQDTRGQSYALRATAARLEAELEDRPIEFPDDVVEGAPGEVATQRMLFYNRKRQQEAQIAVLNAQKSQRKQEITESKSRSQQLRRSLALAQEERDITAPLVKRGISPRLDLIRIDRQVSDLQGELKTIELSMPRLDTAVQEAQQRIDELILSTKAELSNELGRVRTEAKSIGETLTAGEDRVTRTEVRSPVHGTIKQVKHNTVGGVIRPGEDILEIVPLDDTLLIEAQIRPSDIAFLRPGQEATIKVTAYDFSIYGGLKANLETISAGTIKDDKGESFYRVYLRTADTTLKRNGAELPIIPGMTSTVEILTGKKTVLDYLLKPILKARDQALRER